MTYNAILFTDVSDYFIPIRVHGAFSIASHLREHGYTVKVIDHQAWLWENHGAELIRYAESLIGPETIFVGFSSTFSRYFGKPFYGSPGKIKKNLKKNDSFPYMMKFIDRVHLMHPHVKLVLGGQGLQTHTFFTEYKDQLSCWIRGLGEDSILDYVRKNGKGVPLIVEDVFSSKFDFHNQGHVFEPQDDILEHEVLPIAFSRGCRFKCKFCRYPLLGRKPTDNYVRSEESIYTELIRNYENFNTVSYMITDDTFNETTEKIERVVRAVERVGVDMNFWAYIRVELLERFPEQIELLGQMGLKACFFGLESLYDPAARAIGKGMGTEKVLATLEQSKKAWGELSSLHGSFIIGLPHETQRTADEWTEFVINGETALDTISCNALHMVPDSVVNQKNTSRVYYSDFELDKASYGYTETTTGWENENWNYESAQVYAQNVLDKFVEKRPYFTWHKSAQNAMACMNLKVTNPDISWDTIHKPINSDTEEINFNTAISATSKIILDMYKERLFDG